MSEPTVVHSTFVIERRYSKPPEKVFAAFADPVQKRRWFGESDHHDIQEFEMDFRPGGAERASYRFKEGTPFPGAVLNNDGVFLDVVPGRRIVTSSTMAFGDKRFSASLVTFEFLAADGGTDLVCTHQGAFFEGADGPTIREEGWRVLLDGLAKELA